MVNSGAESDYGIVLVTIDSQAQARAIATAIITARLAACVNVFPVSGLSILNLVGWGERLFPFSELCAISRTS